MIDLARRAVACKGWQWLPGMLSLADDEGRRWRLVGRGRRPPALVLEDAGNPIARRHGDAPRRSPRPELGELLPDLTDPCTLGGLLSLVREAWSEWYAAGGSGEPPMRATPGAPLPSARDSAAALVAALGSAP